MPLPDPKLRKQAIEKFGDYLTSKEIAEREWQLLFAESPFLLTESLPIRISSLYPEIELQSGRPDFTFVEHPDPTHELGYYGVIELKRPHDTLLRVYSTQHIAPSAKLAQAEHQVKHYLDELGHAKHLSKQFSLLLGHSSHSFILMGSSAEILRKCTSEFKKLQFRNLLPSGIELVPYDALFERIRRRMTRVLIMEIMPSGTDDLPVREPARFNIVMDDDFGTRDDYLTTLWTSTGMIPIFNGHYRQVFGVPRKIWPLSKERWVDNYFYEYRKHLGDAAFADLLLQARAHHLPFDAFEIRGEFDSNTHKWVNGVQMKMLVKGEGIVEAELSEWNFNFYEGDKMYMRDGRAIITSKFDE